MSFSFEGRRALVTGAGAGLGRAIVAELVCQGAEVVVTDLRGDGARAVAEEFSTAGRRCYGYRLDVTDRDSIDQVVERVHHEHGPLQILVNNAGIVFGGAFLDVPLERHVQTYRVNIEGLVAMTHALLPDLVASEAGRLVNVASASGFIGLPWGATYASSKWSVVGFSESLRMELDELGHRHVRVTTVCPAYIDTGLFDGVRAPRLTRILEPEEVARRLVKAAARGRRRLMLPALTKLGPFGVLMPAALSDGISRVLGITGSMKNWRGPQER